MGANREPISKVDTAWLRMEQPTNLMMITGLVFFNGPINFDDLLTVIENRFLAFRRFRQKAVVGTRQCYWERDPDFDVLSHVRRTALPGKADLYELQELASELASTPLDHSKPLWQFHLVENYEHGPVLITRIHHCYADGIALIQVLLSLTDTHRAGFTEVRSRDHWKARKAAESNIFRRLMEPAKDGIDALSHWANKLVEEGVNLLKEPKIATEYAQLAGEMADELAGAMLLPDDPETRFKGRLGPRKRVAWAPPLELSEVKGVSRALGCTVNDVLIATITGALRHYLVANGDDVDDVEIRATVPVNLRPLEHAKELGNHFGLVFLPLPLGEENPLARLYRVHQFMNELKSSKQAAVAFGLLAALGMGPAMLQKPMLEMMSRKASTVLTNVPGPRQSLYLAGSEVDELMFWVPQTGNIGMGISILSYNQRVYCGLMTDRRLVAEPKRIVDQFRAEFDKLLYLTLMLDEETIADEEAAQVAAHEIIGQELATALYADGGAADESAASQNPEISTAAAPAHDQQLPADSTATPKRTHTTGDDRIQKKIAKKKVAHQRMSAKKKRESKASDNEPTGASKNNANTGATAARPAKAAQKKSTKKRTTTQNGSDNSGAKREAAKRRATKHKASSARVTKKNRVKKTPG